MKRERGRKRQNYINWRTLKLLNLELLDSPHGHQKDKYNLKQFIQFTLKGYVERRKNQIKKQREKKENIQLKEHCERPSEEKE